MVEQHISIIVTKGSAISGAKRGNGDSNEEDQHEGHEETVHHSHRHGGRRSHGARRCGSSGTADSAASGSSGSAKSDTFMAAGLFPLTGSMAYLGPANIATMKLAQKDINAAGGVLGKDIEITSADTSDADHADQNTSSAQSVLAKNPSVVVGPPSSSVVKNTYKQVTSAKVPMISSGATSTAFSGLSDYFFRTIPPDTVQGAVLGQIIAQDGVKNLAIAVFNDEYGTSLRDVVVKTVEDAGVNVVYGEKDTFDPTETNFSSMVTAIKATNPDATLVIAFDQTVPLVKELAAQGLDTHKLYMTDGNTVDHSADFDAGLLKAPPAPFQVPPDRGIPEERQVLQRQDHRFHVHRRNV